MILVAIGASAIGGRRLGNLTLWTVAGCVGSAMGLLAVAGSGVFFLGESALRGAVFALGLCNGVYAAAAIGSMMALAGKGAQAREGTRMGLWGAAQAMALGAGGLTGALLVDIARFASASPLGAYAFVFAIEALAFLASAFIAARIGGGAPATRQDAPDVTVAAQSW